MHWPREDACLYALLHRVLHFGSENVKLAWRHDCLLINSDCLAACKFDFWRCCMLFAIKLGHLSFWLWYINRS